MWYASYMKHRDDIDPERTWVVSDTHFGHENIKSFCLRPSDIESSMMEEWARAVPADDTVLHLGDLNWKSNAWFKNMIAPHLTGARKLLILGNHDKGRFSFYRDCGFKLTKPFKISYRDKVVSFSHYPWSEEDEAGVMPSNEVRIHGHIHNNGYVRNAYVPFMLNHINMSVEQTHYRPVNLAHLLDGALFGEVPSVALGVDEERRPITKPVRFG